jgi:non-heme Fe2+,alpha-ketoglutarate-dependent halogenase
MAKVLNEAQIAQYRRDGYLFPFPALSAQELAERKAGLARFEEWLGAPVNQGDFRWRSASYVFLPWVDALVRHPRILDAVEDLIGPDILVYTATWFIKEAHSPAFAAWHQDATYFGLVPNDQHVTAWVALSDASAEAGCMEVASSQGRPRQTAMMELSAGSFSLHNTLCRHRSAPNRADHRRVGLGISYIPAHCRLSGPVRMCARLVRGKDTGGHFDLIPAPEGELDPAALARHELVYRRYRDNYEEQVQAHERQFAAAD